MPGDREDQECDFYVHTRAQQYLLNGMSDHPETQHNVIMNIDDEGYHFYICLLYTSGNDQKQLAMSDKIEFFSHARLPPSSQGFRMHLKRVMDFSISREAVTPIRKLKTIPANRV